MENQERTLPAHIEAMVTSGQRFTRPTLDAVREFRRSKPWRGNVKERIEKFNTLHAKLADGYGLKTRLVFKGVGANRPSDASKYDRLKDAIVLTGRLSVVTYFHLLCAARELDQRRRFAWSLTLFKRMFPVSWSRCDFDGYMIRKRS